MSAPKTASRHLAAASGPLLPILQHCKTLQRATDLVHPCLPASIRPHCAIANYREGVLILTASSPAWAAKIRYQLPELRKALIKNNELGKITDIIVRTNPHPTATPARPARRAALSQDSAHVLRSLAAHTEHVELSQALSRLAQRARGGKTESDN